MKVLIACEYSGRVREAFRALGHDAWSADLLPAEDKSPYHLQADVVPILCQNWDLVIAHPPCTRLCNSGVRWLHERNLWTDMRKGADFFLKCLHANAPQVAVENPVMHKYAREIIGRGPDFTLQPWEHGDPYKKRTCFWLRGLEPFPPSSIVDVREAAVHKSSPGPDRWKERSRTYPGVAKAIANAWGGQCAVEATADV